MHREVSMLVAYVLSECLVHLSMGHHCPQRLQDLAAQQHNIIIIETSSVMSVTFFVIVMLASWTVDFARLPF